jgi:hypothetical protein
MPDTHDLVYFFWGALLQLFFLGRETLVSLGENEKAIAICFPFEIKKRGGSKLLNSVKLGP